MDIFCSKQCAIASCTDCLLLSDHHKEVQTAETALRDAQRRRAEHSSRLNARKLIISKLPTEILRYIFKKYIDLHDMHPSQYADYPHHKRPRSFPAIHRRVPLLLGAVCQHWRTVAWFFLDLWTTLVISLSCPAYALGPQMVADWLSRAGNRPLFIQMNDSKATYKSCYEPRYDSLQTHYVDTTTQEIVQILNQYASQWRVLDFTETRLHSFYRFLDVNECTEESNLRHLLIGGNFAESDLIDESMDHPVFHSSRRVHHPSHLNVLSAISPENININWTSLTHLHIEKMSRKMLFNFVECTAQTLTHLSVAQINGYDLGDEDWEPDKDVLLPRLISLSINEYLSHTDSFIVLINFVIAPALRSLSYDGANTGFVFPARLFLAFKARSDCVLQDLSLLRTGLGVDDLEYILREVSTVTDLNIRLEQDDWTSSFLQCLAPHLRKTHVPEFLPALSRLNISAYVPKPSWSSFLSIFGDPDQFGSTAAEIPARKNLKISFRVRHLSRHGPHGFMERDSYMGSRELYQLVTLWNQFNILCDIQLEGDPDDGYITECIHSSRNFLWRCLENAQDERPRTDVPLSAMSGDIRRMVEQQF